MASSGLAPTELYKPLHGLCSTGCTFTREPDKLKILVINTCTARHTHVCKNTFQHGNSGTEILHLCHRPFWEAQMRNYARPVSAWLRNNCIHMRKKKKRKKKLSGPCYISKCRLAPQILPWQHSQRHCTNWFMGTDATAFPVACSHHHSSPCARAAVGTPAQHTRPGNSSRQHQRACWGFVLAHKATLASGHESLSEKNPLLSQAASQVSKATRRASNDKKSPKIWSGKKGARPSKVHRLPLHGF